MAITITSVRSNGGDNTFCPQGMVTIQGDGLTAGHIYAIYSSGTIEVTGLTWTGTQIYGNPSYLDILDTGEPGQLLIQNASGEIALVPVTFISPSDESCLHGFFLDNMVTTTGTTYAPPYNYPQYGSLGKITTYNQYGPMGVQFAELFTNPDGSQEVNWSSEYMIPLNQLARIGAPVKTMLKQNGTWDAIMNSGGGNEN